jgi:hypothetical protein
MQREAKKVSRDRNRWIERNTFKERTQTYLPMQYIVLISNTEEERF